MTRTHPGDDQAAAGGVDCNPHGPFTGVTG
jgi:hypothetical protein